MDNIRLGNVEVWPDQHCLRVGGCEVHVEPKVMAVLLTLIQKPDQVVSRQELMETVWRTG